MKRRSTIWIVAVGLLLLSACGKSAPTGHQQTGASPASPAVTQQTPLVEPQSQLKKQTITVFYTDNKIEELKKEEQEIEFADDLEKYKKAISFLEKPKQAEHDPLWQNFKYHSVTFDKGKMTIDADSSNVYNVGAMGEVLAIDALKQTLFQFPEVEKIIILEDGQPIDSLMGHVEIDQALTR